MGKGTASFLGGQPCVCLRLDKKILKQTRHLAEWRFYFLYNRSERDLFHYSSHQFSNWRQQQSTGLLHSVFQIPLLFSQKIKDILLDVLYFLAEWEGFEPSRGFWPPTPLAGEPLRPLGYHSESYAVQFVLWHSSIGILLCQAAIKAFW